jgi:hypothetical protein
MSLCVLLQPHLRAARKLPLLAWLHGVVLLFMEVHFADAKARHRFSCEQDKDHTG